MPFYEYECSNCKFYVETLQKITDEPLKQCPSCKKQTLKKLISAPVFRLKGSGWYETDFKSEAEDKRNLADRDEPAEKAEDSKPAASDAKAEKPEKKAESKPEVKTGVAAKKPAAVKAAPSKGKKPATKAPAKRPAPKKAAPAKKKAKRR
jgi:putative FmdB family regulatory protein